MAIGLLILFAAVLIAGTVGLMIVPNVGVRVLGMIGVGVLSFLVGKHFSAETKLAESVTLVCVDSGGCYETVFLNYIGNRKQTMDRATFGSTKGWQEAIVLEDLSQFKRN